MFTPKAYKLNYVKDEKDATLFADFPNGNYRATGQDVNGKRFSRNYTVNDTKDFQSKWAMWRDYNGRWGLTSLWHITDNGRILIHKKGA